MRLKARIRQYVGVGLANLGHAEMTDKILDLAARLERAQQRQPHEPLSSKRLNYALNKADGSSKNRHVATRNRQFAILEKLGALERGYGWVKWVGWPPFVLLEKNRDAQFKKPKSSSKRLTERPEGRIEKPRAIYRARSTGPAAGNAGGVFENKKNKDKTRRPERAEPFHSTRDLLSQFVPTSTATAACAEDRSSQEIVSAAKSASKWPDSTFQAKPIHLELVTMPSAEAESLTEEMKDPELREIFGKFYDADVNRKRERAAAGLPPLEEYAPKRHISEPLRLMTNGIPFPGQTEPKPLRKKYSLPDDNLLADATWLQLTLGRVPSMHRMGFAWGAVHGFTRGDWRRAIGALLAMPPGRVDAPKSFVIGTLKKMREERSLDPRCRDGYQAMLGWGKEALEFAGVDGRSTH